MRITTILTAAVLAGAPAVASAQNVDARADAAARATTPEARIQAALSAAAQANIPVSLLESKVAEGRAKLAPPEVIAAAVETRLEALLRAASALHAARISAASEGELSVTAYALEAGVSESAVARVARSAPAERRVVAVAVLADLVRLGHDSEPAAVRVSGALNSSAALANLNAEVAAQLRLGGLTATLDAAGVIRVP
jgi:hypothetical protein